MGVKHPLLATSFAPQQLVSWQTGGWHSFYSSLLHHGYQAREGLPGVCLQETQWSIYHKESQMDDDKFNCDPRHHLNQ